jgi:hypothetical protein
MPNCSYYRWSIWLRQPHSKLFKQGEFTMEPQSQMTDLANGMTRAHGNLKEVVFLQKNKNIILIFSDGIMLPTDCKSVSDGRGAVIQSEFTKHAFYGTLFRALGQSPLEFLAFGYIGTGPQCLSTFLRAAGFKSTNVENITSPLRLKADGSQVRGVVQGELIEWDDGKKMSNAGLGEMPKFSQPPSSPKAQSSSETKKAWWEFWK